MPDAPSLSWKNHPRAWLAGFLLAWLPAPGFAATNGVVNLSHYDTATPDFRRMRHEGTQAVIHEATYPPSEGDPKYPERQAAAVRAGLLWGAYHFGNGSDPVRQADTFVNYVAREARQGSGRPGEVLMVLDFELNTHYPGGTMTVPQAVTFLLRVHERTGKYPGLYSNENRIKKILDDPGLSDSYKRVLKRSWLWIANYHREPESSALMGKWMLWQYTGDGVCEMPRGRYPIHCANMRNVERNLFRGSSGALVRFWREYAWTPGGG